MPIAPKISIQQNGDNIQPLHEEAVRFRPILQGIFEDRWFPHTEIPKHVSKSYKNTDSAIGIILQWVEMGVAEINDQSKPGGERKRVFCRFIEEQAPVEEGLDPYLTLFKVNAESGNEQARYHGFRIVIFKPKKVDNSVEEWSYILNRPGEKQGKFCSDFFSTPLKAKERAYSDIHNQLAKITIQPGNP